MSIQGKENDIILDETSERMQRASVAQVRATTYFYSRSSSDDFFATKVWFEGMCGAELEAPPIIYGMVTSRLPAVGRLHPCCSELLNSKGDEEVSGQLGYNSTGHRYIPNSAIGRKRG